MPITTSVVISNPLRRGVLNTTLYDQGITFIFSMFQISFIENIVINIYEVGMLLFDNSVLKMYMLNTQLSLHINSLYYFILFISFIKQFVGSIW